MGNWGNTLDRWYHRAVVIVWPGDRAFANRAETSPAWTLDELAAMASAGDVSGGRAAAATLASFWDGAERAQAAAEGSRASGLFGKALRAADDVADAETAAMLLHPFCVDSLTAVHVGSFGKIVAQYGRQWMASLLRTWFGGDQPTWAYGAGLDRPQWVAEQLPGLCAGLHATASAGVMATQRLLDLAWEWTSNQIGTVLAPPSPSYRDKQLTGLGKPLAAVRAPDDWSIELPSGGCTCELCDTLRAFLSDKNRRTFEWPLAKERRQHIHSRIDSAELAVSHLTRRQGRPYTLVLSKTGALFAREREARIRDESDLEWLDAKWAVA